MSILRGYLLPVLLASSLLPAVAYAQSRALGVPATPEHTPTLEQQLGACPIEELRAAWIEAGALESAAIEEEVLRMCAERAKAIEALLLSQRQLRSALNQIREPSVDPVPTPVRTPNRAMGIAAALTPSAQEREAMAEAPETTPSEAATTEEPPMQRVTIWQALFAVRSGDGPWRARIQRGWRIIPVGSTLATAPPVDGDTTWETDVSVSVTAGDRLGGALEVISVDQNRVEVRPIDGGASFSLPWIETGDPNAPGIAEWTFEITPAEAEAVMP